MIQTVTLMGFSVSRIGLLREMGLSGSVNARVCKTCVCVWSEREKEREEWPCCVRGLTRTPVFSVNNKHTQQEGAKVTQTHTHTDTTVTVQLVQ